MRANLSIDSSRFGILNRNLSTGYILRRKYQSINLKKKNHLPIGKFNY